MTKEHPGRPKNFTRRHIIEIKEDTREWLGEQVTRALTLKYAGEATRTVGEVLKGAVSHPIGIAMVGGFLTAYLIGLFGGKGEEGDTLMEKVKEQMEEGNVPVPDVFFNVWETTYEVSRFMFPFLPIFPTVGSTPPVEPPTEKERLCTQLSKELELAYTNRAEEPGKADFWDAAIARIIQRQSDAGC